MQVLHRVRDRLVGQRTSLTNQIRSILLERGIVVPQGRRSLLEALAVLSSEPDGSRVGTRVQRLLDDMLDQWRALDARIKALDDEFAEMARNDPAARRLATIPGIGVLNATALVAAIGDGRTFSRGRDLSAWLGLVPHQATTGGRPKLLGITKRGSRYLRKLVIQGARAALPSLARTATPLGGWLRGLLARAHGNTVVVALASKLIESPGRSCATRPGSSPAAQQWRRTGSAGGDHPTSRAVEGLRVVEARWPDSQPVSQQPMPSNGTRCRPLYQDRDARISILARVEP